jgi:hypothetical protein
MLAGASSAAYIGTVAAECQAASWEMCVTLTLGTHSDTENQTSGSETLPRFRETRTDRSSNKDCGCQRINML